MNVFPVISACPAATRTPFVPFPVIVLFWIVAFVAAAPVTSMATAQPPKVHVSTVGPDVVLKIETPVAELKAHALTDAVPALFGVHGPRLQEG